MLEEIWNRLPIIVQIPLGSALFLLLFSIPPAIVSGIYNWVYRTGYRKGYLEAMATAGEWEFLVYAERCAQSSLLGKYPPDHLYRMWEQYREEQ